MAGIAFATSAYQIVPLLRDSALINHSRWEPVWKWDSFGAWPVLSQLARGELLDHGRLPVLTVLAAAGAAIVWWARRRGRRAEAGEYFCAAATLWLLMYIGRPFWGSLLTAMGALGDMHLHRVLGGAQVFLVLLAAVALSQLWTFVGRRSIVGAIGLTAILLYPAVREREQYLAKNAGWGRDNLKAFEVEGGDLQAAIGLARSHPGRVYAGLASGWGGTFKVGQTPVYATLSANGVPSVGFLYHAMALTGDLMVRLDESRADHLGLFGIGTVIAPPGAGPRPLLSPIGRFGRFEVLSAPGAGYFGLADAVATVKVNKRNFYEVNDRWLQSDWPARHEHLLLDMGGTAPADLPRMEPSAGLVAVGSGPPPAGKITGEMAGERYQAEVNLQRPTYVLLKMTWHPGWKARVDGADRPVAALSPGFAAVAVGEGRHRVEFAYEPGPGKELLALGGLLVLLLIGNGGRLGLDRVWALAVLPDWRRLRPAGITVAICLPVCLPLLTSSLIAGHDSYCYFPRLVEIHRNVFAGVMLPRWAPDLGSGHGQPLFVFHPPLFYWVGEVWQLLGFDAVTAANLASAAIVLAAGFGAFYLGRLYFGAWGGYIAAAAYVYAPYFAVDLYVRSALEEFTAFALFPLVLYGFGAFGRYGRFRDWAIGASAFGALLYCHFPAALLFSPLLAAFCAVTAWQERSWRVLAAQAGGVALGLALGAASWFPALAEKQYVSMDRVLEGDWLFSNHFVFPAQLLSTFWGYGYSVAGPQDGMSFSLGWSHVLVAAIAWAWWSRKTAYPDLARFFGAAAGVFCVLMIDDSAWVWEHAPLLKYVELPWRMLGPAALCLAILAAAAGPWIARLTRYRGFAMAGVIAILIVPNLTHLRAGRADEVDLAFFTPREMAARGFETTTMRELTPHWMSAPPPYDPIAATVGAGDAEVRDVARGALSWTGEVKARAASRIRASMAWYPGWTVRVDDREVEAGPSAGSGLVEFTVPAGNHRVEVAFGRSPFRRTGEIVTLVGIFVLAAVWRIRRRAERPRVLLAETAHA
jgi:hypothetical protein